MGTRSVRPSLAERQTDFEELVTGPPVSAAFKPDGTPTPAASGFAKKYSVEVTALEKSETPKGAYPAYRVRQRGQATVAGLAEGSGAGRAPCCMWQGGLAMTQSANMSGC